MKAYSYIRMSSEGQLKGNSLARQLSMAREYAAQNNWELVEDIYQDLGISAYRGKNAQKGKLGAFIEALETGKIPNNSKLIVESLDRLSRQSPTKAFTQLNELLEYGIEIHTLFDRQIYTKKTLNEVGLLFSSIGQMQRAHFESETKSRRLKKSWEHKRQSIEKKILTSTCPKWLKPKTDKTGFEIIEDRAKTVKAIFDLCIDSNMGVFSITRYLNKNLSLHPSFSTPTKKNRTGYRATGWHMSYIQKILNNPSVHGQFQPSVFDEGIRNKSNEIYPDYYPVVISFDRFLLAQSKIKRRSLSKGGRKGQTFNNLFSKLLICGHCGGVVRLVDKGAPPKGGKYLHCTKSLYKGGCQAASWRYDDFEDDFLKYVSELNLDEIFSKKDRKSELLNIRDELEILNEKQVRVKKAIDNLTSSLSELTEGARKHVTASLDLKSHELEELKKKQLEIQLRLLELENLKPNTVQEELINLIKSRRISKSDDDVIMRRKVNKSLVELLSRIEIFPFSGDFLPYDVLETIGPKLRKRMAKDGYDTDEMVSELLLKKNGKQIYNKMIQYFVITFQNGEEKIVHPYIGMNLSAKGEVERESIKWKIQKKTKKSAVRGNLG